MSDVSVRTEELVRFITAPIRVELARLEEESGHQAQRVRQSSGTRHRQRQLAQAVQRRELEEKSLSEQADALRAGLTGLSEEDRALLNKGKVFDAADRCVLSWRDGVNSFREGATTLLQMIRGYLTHLEPAPTEPEAGILGGAREQYRALLADVEASIEDLITRADAVAGGSESAHPENPWRQWSEKMGAFKAAYDAAVQRSSAHSEKMRQLREIEEDLSNHVRETVHVREEIRTLSTAESNYRNAREGWEDLIKQRDDLLDAQCRDLTEHSGGAIRAHVRRYSDAADFVNSLRQFLSGSRVQGSKIEALGEFITSSSDPFLQWNALLADLEKLSEFDTERDGADRRPDTPTLFASGL